MLVHTKAPGVPVECEKIWLCKIFQEFIITHLRSPWLRWQPSLTQQPVPAVLTPGKGEESPQTKTLVAVKWALNKSFCTGKKFDITAD